MFIIVDCRAVTATSHHHPVPHSEKVVVDGRGDGVAPTAAHSVQESARTPVQKVSRTLSARGRKILLESPDGNGATPITRTIAQVNKLKPTDYNS